MLGWSWCGRQLPQPTGHAMPEEGALGVRVPGKAGLDQDALGQPRETRDPAKDQRVVQPCRQQLRAKRQSYARV